jgi:hypothetical protein
MHYLLSLYGKPARKIKRSNQYGNMCLVSFGIWIGALTASSVSLSETTFHKSNTFELISYSALPTSLISALIFGGLHNKLEDKAIQEYNLATEKKNTGL